MHYRKLGQTSIELSILGMGGIVVCSREQDDANREVASAVDRGVTYFDVAPSYGDAEDRLGPALKPFRSQVTLACKTGRRDAEGAAEELASSLDKLQTDHFDLYQMHGLSSLEEAQKALSEGGAIETFLKAKQEGKTRYIGFSAHDQDAALFAIESGHFDTILFPLNYLIYTHGKFGPRVLEAANAAGMGVLAIKGMARAKLEKGEPKPFKKCWYTPEDREEVARKLLRFTLSLPGVVAAVPPGDEHLFNLAMSFVDELDQPLSDAEVGELDEALGHLTPVFAAG